MKSKVMGLPVPLVAVRVTVYWILTGVDSFPCVVTLSAAVAVSSSRMLAVAVAVAMVTLALEELLIVPSTVSVISRSLSSITVTVVVPVVAPSTTLMLPPETAV